jgi:hypothetical protein
MAANVDRAGAPDDQWNGWALAPNYKFGARSGRLDFHDFKAFSRHARMARHVQKQLLGIEPSRTKKVEIMRTKMLIATVATFACAAGLAVAQSTNGPGPGGSGPQGIQQQDRDRLQTCSPDLEQDRTRLRQCLPAEVKDAVKQMSQERAKHQQQLRDKQKEVAACTDQERVQLRDQLREQIKDQARDREQLRERLRELRECLPSHQELMEQAREQARERKRRGE